jgi:hypothetical protein
MANICLKLYTNAFFGSILKSPMQMGSLSVYNSVTNISRLGTFKVPKKMFGKTQPFAGVFAKVSRKTKMNFSKSKKCFHVPGSHLTGRRSVSRRLDSRGGNPHLKIHIYVRETRPPIYRNNKFFVYFFGGLESVGHSFAHVAHFVFSRDAWIET